MNYTSRIKSIFFTAFPFILFGVYRSLVGLHYMDNQNAIQLYALACLVLSAAVLVVEIRIKEKNYLPVAAFLFFAYFAALIYFIPADDYKTIITGNNFIAALLHGPGLGFYATLFFIAFIPPGDRTGNERIVKIFPVF